MNNANSISAFENSTNFSSTHEDRIVNVLENFKTELTYNEIAKKGNFSNPNQVSRRLKVLCDTKRIIQTESRICSIAKSMCATYKIN